MLGQDINSISKIDKQDEYQISSKIPQSQDRTNMIIGDFITSHYAYGSQQQVLDETDILNSYQILSNETNSNNNRTNRCITQQVNEVTTLRSGGKYYMKNWVKDSTSVIQNPLTNEFLCIRNKLKINDGEQIIHSYISTTQHIKHACMFNLNVNSIEPIHLNNSASVLNTPFDPKQNLPVSCYPVPQYFQKNTNSNHFKFKKHDDDTFVIMPENATNLCLSITSENKIQYNTNITRWKIINVSEFENYVILGNIVRYDDENFSNDATYATCNLHSIPDDNILREWKWMVSNYIWEKIKLNEHEYKLKIVADDASDSYLNYCDVKKQLFVDEKGLEWNRKSLSCLTK